MQQIDPPDLLNRMAAEGYTKQRSEYDPTVRLAQERSKKTADVLWRLARIFFRLMRST
jgi:hypothetical protein